MLFGQLEPMLRSVDELRKRFADVRGREMGSRGSRGQTASMIEELPCGSAGGQKASQPT